MCDFACWPKAIMFIGESVVCFNYHVIFELSGELLYQIHITDSLQKCVPSVCNQILFYFEMMKL